MTISQNVASDITVTVNMRTVLDASITEKQFQAAIVALAKVTGWLCYHTYDARHSAPGFPDLVLIRGTQLIFAELKTARGRVSVAQSVWIRALQVIAAKTRGIISIYVWRPSDWPDIERLLIGHK